ncbi:hypothetical protein I545_0201 [Mycobacterium kansasii 662]|uniref:Uncharacterized protein n=2 Tax=Mycobacterium kansasii TaxID=1768 RepID=A0A1V3WMW3_MYCKA|nr:hypothetical protein I547_1218 [Mycobacterium kansasii 824]EUA20979.1 hypothetical protein I545_0201 [Mycobacterium kansasii 662]KEP43787.1 hypothetical protein MKSMC1_11510 [Mycobacterium kansasii]OOK67766.1 hypothetical protein BZL30_7678 [Mycobacterium kansasii]OOK84200.1 hypothetical protein BZL29_0245 [Mycobacterium kansasii]
MHKAGNAVAAKEFDDNALTRRLIAASPLRTSHRRPVVSWSAVR